MIEAVTDAAGDVEFPLANGGYVVYRIDEAPKGYFVPNKLTVGTLLDAEEVVREGSDMFVTGELVIEKLILIMLLVMSGFKVKTDGTTTTTTNKLLVGNKSMVNGNSLTLKA